MSPRLPEPRALVQLPDVTPWVYSHGDGYPPEVGAQISVPTPDGTVYLRLEADDAEEFMTAIDDALSADMDDIRRWDAADARRAREKEG